MITSAIAMRPQLCSPKDVQWIGLMWAMVMSLGIMTSKSNAFRFGLMSPNWLYYFERWMAYGILAMTMPILCMLGWSTWKVVRAHAAY